MSVEVVHVVVDIRSVKTRLIDCTQVSEWFVGV
jgi:hypothetical protein